MDKYPGRDTIPAWYELVIEGEDTLLLRVHAKAMEHFRETAQIDSRIMKSYKEEFSKNPFILPETGKAWGFGEVMFPQESNEKNWLVYAFTLPVLNNRKASVEEKEKVLTLRGTLSLFFMILRYFEEDTECARPQLMIIESLTVKNGPWGGALSVLLTPKTAEWLSKQPNNYNVSEMEEAMKLVGHYMWGKEKDFYDLYRHDFRALCRKPKWLNISVPGDACGLDPDYRDGESKYGYTLHPHNTDSSWQQFMILAGLAKLHELVRKG